MAADVEWMMDSLVQFLMSPVWSFHVNNFVDQNCLIFDTEEENKFSYTDAHRQYQTIVENLLQEFMKELHMTMPQLINACSEGMAKSTKLEKLFQPLLAVDDFLLFKSIMVQRNLQLDEEVLKNLQDSKTSPIHNKEVSSTPTSSIHANDEDKILQDVLVKSKIEHEQHVQQEEERFQKLIRQATEESLKTYELEVKKSTQSNSSDPVPAPVSTATNSQSNSVGSETELVQTKLSSKAVTLPALPSHLVSSIASSSGPVSLIQPNAAIPPITNIPTKNVSHFETPSDLPKQTSSTILEQPLQPPVTSPLSESTTPRALATEAATNWLQNARTEAQTHTSSINGTAMINEEDSLQKREDYLKRQRDQLIAHKVKKREAELKDFLKDNPQCSENGPITRPPMNNIAVNCQKESKAIKGKEKRKAKPVLTPAVADKITH